MPGSAIDISRLPPPVIPGLLTAAADLEAEYDRWLNDVYRWRPSTSAADPSRRLLRLMALRESLLRRAIRDAVASTSIAFADDVMLDHIGVTYARLARLEGEDDDTYRARLAGASALFAVGLTGPWYEVVALGVDGVRDAEVQRTAPGAVTVWVMSTDDEADGIPDADILAAVRAAVAAPEDRQQTDTVTVSACTRTRWSAAVALTVRPGASTVDVRTAAEGRAAELGRALARLGAGVHPEIVAAAMVDRELVVDAAIALSDAAGNVVAEIAGTPGAAPQATAITVTAA